MFSRRFRRDDGARRRLDLIPGSIVRRYTKARNHPESAPLASASSPPLDTCFHSCYRQLFPARIIGVMNPLRPWISTLLLLSFLRLQFACCGGEVEVCQASALAAASSCPCPHRCGERPHSSAEAHPRSSTPDLAGLRSLLALESFHLLPAVTELPVPPAPAIANSRWDHDPRKQPTLHLYLMAHAGMLFSQGRPALASKHWTVSTAIALPLDRISFFTLDGDHRSSPKLVDDRPHERIRLCRLRI